MVETGIHPPQPSPHPDFWVTGGENFGSGPYILHQDWVCTDWFSHFISAKPNKYNEWLDKVEIGVCALKWSLQSIFQPWEGTNSAWPIYLLFKPKLCLYWLIQAIHSIPTLPMCHYKYNEWLEKVEIGIHPPQPSPHSNFWVEGGEIWIQGPYVSHQVWVCTDWISHFISAQPIQSLIISIMNGYTRLRLVHGL